MAYSIHVYRKAGLSARARDLLHRIDLWWPYAKIERGGHRWIVKARDEWSNETGLSLSQYDRAVAELKKLGWVVTEQHKFGKKQTAITYLRLCEAQVQQVCETYKVPQKCGTQVQHKCETLRSNEGTKRKEGTQGSLSAASLCSLSVASDREELLREEFKQAAQQGPPYPPAPLPPGEPVVATVAEIAKIAEATKLATREKNKAIKVDPTAKDTPGAMHLIWQQAMGEIDQHVGGMTGPVGGMLKNLVKQCPPGVARAALPFVVSEWNSFKVTLEHDYGLWNVATKPVLPLLVKHSDKLVTWYLRRQKEEALHEAHKAPGASTAPTLPGNGSTPATAQKSGVGVPIKPPVAEEDIPGSPTHRFESLLDIYDGDLARTKEEWLASKQPLPAKYAELVS